MSKLILIRHGHTRLNLPGENERLRAWLDIPLDEQGLQEAKDTAAAVASQGIKTIYSSDLTRAIQTATAISLATCAPLIPIPELRPWNLGSFAGQLIKEVVPFLDLLNERSDIPAPGGESWNQFYVRYSRRLLSLMELAVSSGRTIAAVTHVRNFLSAPTIIEAGDKSRVPVKGGPRTGSIYLIEKVGGKWRLRAGQPDPTRPLVEEFPAIPAAFETAPVLA